MKYRIIQRTYGVITEYMPQRKWLGIWWNISPFWCRCYATAEEKILESKAGRQKKDTQSYLGGIEMKDFLWRLLDWVVGAFIGVVLYCIVIGDTPTALDVYRGKTTLEITYRDSVAIDSTVVYKVK